MLDTFAPSSPAAPSTPPMDMADLLVTYLEQLGIEYAFGIPGGAILPRRAFNVEPTYRM